MQRQQSSHSPEAPFYAKAGGIRGNDSYLSASNDMATKRAEAQSKPVESVEPLAEELEFDESAIKVANEFFGFDGWNSSIVGLSIDCIDHQKKTKSYDIGITATVRVTLKSGVYHEGVGCGTRVNASCKAWALEVGKKTAVANALKHALRMFGLKGNALNDGQLPGITPKYCASDVTPAAQPFSPGTITGADAFAKLKAHRKEEQHMAIIGQKEVEAEALWGGVSVEDFDPSINGPVGSGKRDSFVVVHTDDSDEASSADEDYGSPLENIGKGKAREDMSFEETKRDEFGLSDDEGSDFDGLEDPEENDTSDNVVPSSTVYERNPSKPPTRRNHTPEEKAMLKLAEEALARLSKDPEAQADTRAAVETVFPGGVATESLMTEPGFSQRFDQALALVFQQAEARAAREKASSIQNAKAPHELFSTARDTERRNGLDSNSDSEDDDEPFSPSFDGKQSLGEGQTNADIGETTESGEDKKVESDVTKPIVAHGTNTSANTVDSSNLPAFPYRRAAPYELPKSWVAPESWTDEANQRSLNECSDLEAFSRRRLAIHAEEQSKSNAQAASAPGGGIAPNPRLLPVRRNPYQIGIPLNNAEQARTGEGLNTDVRGAGEAGEQRTGRLGLGLEEDEVTGGVAGHTYPRIDYAAYNSAAYRAYRDMNPRTSLSNFRIDPVRHPRLWDLENRVRGRVGSSPTATCPWTLQEHVQSTTEDKQRQRQSWKSAFDVSGNGRFPPDGTPTGTMKTGPQRPVYGVSLSQWVGANKESGSSVQTRGDAYANTMPSTSGQHQPESVIDLSL